MTENRRETQGNFRSNYLKMLMIRLIGFVSTITSMLGRECQSPLGLKCCKEQSKILQPLLGT